MSTGESQTAGYRIAWRSSGIRAGAHKGRTAGNGGLLRANVPLIQNPDPRRIALRETLRDPAEQILVRQTDQLTSVTVFVLIDVSASMVFAGHCRKIAVACDIAEALSAAAHQAGDAFGLIAFDAVAREPFVIRKSRSRPLVSSVLNNLRAFKPAAAGIAGLSEAAGILSGEKKLVVLISDFLWDPQAAEAALLPLARHDIVPVEIEDSRQFDDLPDWGLLNLADLETGKSRLIAMRPSLKRSWLERRDERRSAIRGLFRRLGRHMLTVKDRIDWDRLEAHLMTGGE